MTANSRITRQSLACGYEPPAPPGHRVDPWRPPPSSIGYRGGVPKTCAGYTTSLPDVFEVLRARSHWKVGQLEAFTGEPPTEQLLLGIEVLDGACATLERWMMTDAKDGGGRE